MIIAKAGVPQGSIFGPLFLLICINDLSLGLKSNVKLFADDTSWFSIVHDPTISANILNEDLDKINKWDFEWKMAFNLDITKQAQEVIFTEKIKKSAHQHLFFNNSIVQKTETQKNLGLILDNKLLFNHHVKDKIAKVNRGIGVLRKLQNYLSRACLPTIYKSFIKSHLEYADVIYDQPNNI